MSSSRSSDNSKDNSQSDTTADVNDTDYQPQTSTNEQQTIDTKKVKDIKVNPVKEKGYLNNGFSLRKFNF